MTGAQDEPNWDGLRDAELARHVESMREQGFTGPLPADVEFVRYIGPDEWGRVRAQCFRDHGIDADEDLLWRCQLRPGARRPANRDLTGS